ncbi:hypothetical protein M0811_10846 [Anaeramoeba ignava]|uniref:BTB domain-containing protein n=1 Tax=Anaeramoeba ignava TaxID=1746090 RepID=A0A9Q0LCY0_ANAIG|nr:hypothetical protein M0811_10846 [Anaeramoeba ignava]
MELKVEIKQNPNTKNHPGAKYGQCMGIYKENIYIFGGVTMQGYDNRISAYNMKKDEWIELTEQNTEERPTPRSGHMGTYHDEKMYIFGGLHRHLFFNDLYCFDMNKHSWKKMETKGEAPETRSRFGFTYFDSKLFIFGGFHETNYVNTLYSLDLLTSTWSKCETSGDTFVEKGGFSTALAETMARLYLFGGVRFRQHDNDLFELDLKMYSIKKIICNGNVQPCPRRNHSAIVYDQRMFVFGGKTQDDVPLNDIFMFDFKSLTWTEIIYDSSSVVPRVGFAMDIDKRFNCWIYGGYNYTFLDDLVCFSFPNIFNDSLFIDLKSLFIRQELTNENIISKEGSNIGFHYVLVHHRLKSHLIRTNKSSSKSQIEKLKLTSRNYDESVLKCFLVYLYSAIVDLKILRNSLQSLQQLEALARKFHCDPLVEYLEFQTFQNNLFEFLIQDLKELKNQEETKDFTIKIPNENKHIRVHSLILLARSELYRGMLISVNDESKSAPDFSGRSFKSIKKIVKYFYTGKIKGLTTQIREELEDASDYYGFSDSLKLD